MNDYRHLQRKLRLQILDLYHRINAGHIGGSLSCIDILISIFFFQKQKNDAFILSKGHSIAALYCCLNELGELPDAQLATFYQNGTKLPAHPAPGVLESIPFATGSLGHGFPLAAGIAKARKMKNDPSFVYALLSDGDTNEGTTWEAAHFAVMHHLQNLILVIDKNRVQGFGKTSEVLGDTADGNKWTAMGFTTVEIDDGNDVELLNRALQALRTDTTPNPRVLIANTTKGKGVSYMENTVDWHYWPMNEEQFTQAKMDIENRYA